ncbi:PQQ-dependent sugar dehydrogenase [Hydrogenophaga sp.]|uniref:PQQ-dependent sugar dehydrogenase n=1 Tax=Hydrogenophaga sp. TaxID=1904254 RepID=UPI0027284EB6|nr:PQQ-dependent sugar dehydrogenase [Hydrogenophaga sp.]MDO9506861.1 PQQ-dependent sugar dehydrogenase [Hydrogenophaga sp.]MDP2986913.1 PQQ-dependent sugar dehydrogenase [Hydrogenophaga sp.]MDP3626391.1 PQQ-dependent sugar dehydrogenase [Hydrogenophaga sp.]
MKYVLAFFVGAWVLVTSAQAAGYRVETVASGLEHPWSLAFLPGGRLLVTERPGRLRVIEPGPDGRLQLRPEPVAGVPAVLARGQAGLFDVVVDPAFAVNSRVLLSFAHGQTEANHLRVVRARFDGRQLLEVQPIFTSQPAKTETQHFGGRMAWLADGSLLLGMGDGNLDRTDAQRLHTHLGKLLRIQPDGSVPGDNPFLQRPNARPEIYSIGHRNPQGMVVVDGVPYAHEHGARGGDELNRIEPGANYGWPLTTGGIDYTYARITPYRSLPGIQPALVEWTPSIAPAGLTWYDGPLFPAWRGSLFVAALKERSVRRVPLPGGVPGPQEILFQELGERIRDVRAGPDGAIYLLTDSVNGRVLRVVPTTP